MAGRQRRAVSGAAVRRGSHSSFEALSRSIGIDAAACVATATEPMCNSDGATSPSVVAGGLPITSDLAPAVPSAPDARTIAGPSGFLTLIQSRDWTAFIGRPKRAAGATNDNHRPRPRQHHGSGPRYPGCRPWPIAGRPAWQICFVVRTTERSSDLPSASSTGRPDE
jgi:hypothetical protein